MSHSSTPLANGTILHGKRNYTIKRMLGRGSFGITYEATATVIDGNIRQSMRYTLKEFFMDSVSERKPNGTAAAITGQEDKYKTYREYFALEAKRMQDVCRHKNIVSVNEVFNDLGTSYYVMEYLEGMSLHQFVKEGGVMSESEAVRIVAATGDALAFLHERMINHLDVKPENIMLVCDDRGTRQPVLIDFGLSRHFKKSGSPTSTLATFGCSDGYSPIEQYAGIDRFSPESDVYALAATLLFMLTGQTPCRSTEMSEEYRRCVLPQTVSPVMVNALNRALMNEASLRCKTIPEFISLLPNQTHITSATNSRTRIIGEAPARRPIARKPNWKLIAAIALVVIIGAAAVALIPKIINTDGGDTSARTTVTQSDTTTTTSAGSDTTSNTAQTSRPCGQTTTTIEEEKKPANTQSVKQQAELSSQVAQTTEQRTESQDAKTDNPASAGYDLGYATYEGSLRNNLPHGRGSITMKTNKMFVSANNKDTIYAKAGDVLRSTFYGGHITQLTGVAADGSHKVLVLGN